MLTAEKMKQVQKRLSGGQPEGEIKLQLREEGFTEAEIKEIFKPRPTDTRSWFLFFGCLFTVAGFYLLATGRDWHLLLFGGGLLVTWSRLGSGHKKSSHE